jgi:negative regulator of genetic competence, sporulation and motility
MPIRNKHIGRDGKILTANITLKNTKVGPLNQLLFADFGDKIYKATFTTIYSGIHDMLLLTYEESYFLEILFWKDKESIWEERLTLSDMEEFYKEWNIIDRRVLIEKTGYY